MAGENYNFVTFARMSRNLLDDTRYSRVIRLLIEDNLTVQAISDQENVPYVTVGLISRRLYAEGKITKKLKIRRPRQLKNANIKTQIYDFLSANPTATNEQVFAALQVQNALYLQVAREKLCIQRGKRNDAAIRYTIIKASRAAGVKLEELAKIFKTSCQRIEQIESSNAFNEVDNDWRNHESI
jgi:hypothetical protein